MGVSSVFKIGECVDSTIAIATMRAVTRGTDGPPMLRDVLTSFIGQDIAHNHQVIRCSHGDVGLLYLYLAGQFHCLTPRPPTCLMRLASPKNGGERTRVFALKILRKKEGSYEAHVLTSDYSLK
jgi:hypothetical protein